MPATLHVHACQCKGEGKINRPEAASRSLRRWKKLCGKTNWFKIKQREPTEAEGINVERTRKFMNPATRAQVEGVLYVPYTKNSLLKKKMQEAEDSLMLNKHRCHPT